MLVLGYRGESTGGGVSNDVASAIQRRVHVPMLPPELKDFNKPHVGGQGFAPNTGGFYQIPSSSRSVAIGDGLSQGPHLMVGEELEVRVFCFTADGVECSPVAPGTKITFEMIPRTLAMRFRDNPKPVITDCHDGTFSIKYSILTPGRYTPVVKIDGLDIQSLGGRTQNNPGDVLELEFATGRACPSTCEISGDGSVMYQYDTPNYFVITAFDEFGNQCSQGGDRFGVRSSGNVNVQSVIDNGNGTYSVSYTVIRPMLAKKTGSVAMMNAATNLGGEIVVLEVLLMGRPVNGSPIRPVVSENALLEIVQDHQETQLGNIDVAANLDVENKDQGVELEAKRQAMGTLVQQLDNLGNAPGLGEIDAKLEKIISDRQQQNVPQFGTEMNFLVAEEWARISEIRTALANYRDALIQHQQKLVFLGRTIDEDCQKAVQEQEKVRNALFSMSRAQDKLQQTKAEIDDIRNDPALQSDIQREHREHLLREKEEYVDKKLKRLEHLEKIMIERGKGGTEPRIIRTNEDMAYAEDDLNDIPTPDERAANDPANLHARKRELMKRRRELRYAKETLDHSRAIPDGQHLYATTGAGGGGQGMKTYRMGMGEEPIQKSDPTSGLGVFDGNSVPSKAAKLGEKDFLNDLLGISSKKKGPNPRTSMFGKDWSHGGTNYVDQKRLLIDGKIEYFHTDDLARVKAEDNIRLRHMQIYNSSRSPPRNLGLASDTPVNKGGNTLGRLGRCMRRIFKFVATGTWLVADGKPSCLQEALLFEDLVELSRVAELDLRERALFDVFCRASLGRDITPALIDEIERKGGIMKCCFENFADVMIGLARLMYPDLQDAEAAAKIFSDHFIPLSENELNVE